MKKKIQMYRLTSECGAKIETRYLSMSERKHGYVFCPIVYVEPRLNGPTTITGPRMSRKRRLSRKELEKAKPKP
jgi:hypothetical protein